MTGRRVGRTPPNTPFGPTEVPQGVRCRRCRYDLRGLTPAGRCPECGLAIGLSLPTGGASAKGDRWESIHEGLSALAQGFWWFLPFAVGCTAIGGLSPLTTLIAAGYAGWHFLAVRSIAKGLDEFPEGGESLATILSRARGAAWAQLAVGYLAGFLVLEGGAVNAFPGPDHLIGLAILFPVTLLALVTARNLALALARQTSLATTAPTKWGGILLVVVGAALAAATVWGVANRVVLAANGGDPTSDPTETLFVASFAILGPAWVGVMWLHRLLCLRVAIAVPQLAAFNRAAERVERGPPPPVRNPRSETDLPPVELAPEPKGPPRPS